LAVDLKFLEVWLIMTSQVGFIVDVMLTRVSS